MANQIGLRPESMKTLKSLVRRKKVSMQGLISVLILMADRQRDDLGIIDLDWDKIREECPTVKTRNRKTWEVVVMSVRELMKEFTTPDEIALHSRWTLPQVERAMKEINDEQ